MNDGPIGVFDSGLGGLSVWRQIRLSLPEESIIYYGDRLNCPYGNKPLDEIRGYTEEAVKWLLAKGVKIVVVACNTATAAAIEYLREKYYGTPFVGMEPAVKPAALSTRTGIVAVLATEASFKGELYRRTSEKYGKGIDLIPVAGNGLVELVEGNMENMPEAYETMKNILSPALDAGADRIVLGCTHYPFLMEQMRRVIGERDVEIVDSAPAVARRVMQVMDEMGLRVRPGHTAEYSFHTAATGEYAERLAEKARALSGMAV